jgi:myo-inositol-1-phosphate synthase
VRLIKLALNNGIAGQLDGPSSYLMKSPHSQRPDDEARDQTEEFIATYARKAAASRAKEDVDSQQAEATKAEA